ncbi:MAG: GPP34 family phosphoprotein [Kineosporiaceae bacterium]
MLLSLPEEVLLLLLHDVRGKPLVDGNGLNAALAGAALVELTLDGALRLSGPDEPEAKPGRLVATGRPPRDPRLVAIIERMNGKKPKDAIGSAISAGWHPAPTAGLRQSLLQDLMQKSRLTEEKGTILGFIPTTSWPQGQRRDVENALVARVREVVVAEQQPDARTAALVSLLSAVDALPKIFPDENKKALRHRGKQVSESDLAGTAVHEALQAIQAAMTVAMTVAIGTAIVAS